MDETPKNQDVTVLLTAWQEGNEQAFNDLVPLVYGELRKLARHYLRGEREGHTLQPTALVNEAFLKLVDQNVRWQNRSHFFAIAANLMRRILVDHARAHKAQKRGSGGEKVELDEAFIFASEKSDELVALDEALERFAEIDPKRARVVELRFFGGLNNEEIAEVMDVHPNTVIRDWTLARAWLKTQLAK